MLANLRTLHLTLEQLVDVRDAMHQKILQGLEAHDREIKALPAYLHRPWRALAGNAVVLDVGGTHIRAARVRLQGGAAEVHGAVVSDDAMMQRAKTPRQVSARQFFARQAELITQVCSASRIKVGYCFSYPAEITPECEAKLLKWTKGIQIEHVEGTSVGAQLHEALRERGKEVVRLQVLNDTVASLLAGTMLALECTHYIGLIVGTGTNMAGFFPVRRLTKLASDQSDGWHDDAEMAVNLESGNFTPPHLSEYDDMLDRGNPSDHPGAQRFEKAVSGAYLPRLFGYVVGHETCLQLGFHPEAPDAHAGLIAHLRDYPGVVGEAATVLLNRSADLVAAALAGLIQAYEPERKGLTALRRRSRATQVGILAEGTLFWHTPGYYDRVQQTLAGLVARHTTTQILRCPSHVDANFLGAACAALA